MTCRRLIKFILFLVCAGVLLLSPKAFGQIPPEKNPRYASYSFDKSGKTIYFGMQPMSIPVGVVEAVLQRDALLAETLRSQGLRIVFYPFLKGSDINAFMQRGDVDIAVAGDAPVVTAASRMEISILALGKQGASSVITWKHYVSLHALAGKRIAYPEGSTAHLGLLVALSAVGLDDRSVTLVPMEVSNMTPALLAGQIDAFCAFEPTPSLATAAHKELRAVARFLNTSYLYASRAFLKKHPRAAEQIAAAYVRAVRWLRASEKNLSLAAEWAMADADAFLQKPASLKQAILMEITRNDLLRFGDPVLPAKSEADQEHLHKIFQVLKAKGMVGESVAWERVRTSIDRSVLQKILASPRQFRLDAFAYPSR
jgi:ABC-type nitrate/sulfonate/bicarbonate transport system substrate-binding protein